MSPKIFNERWQILNQVGEGGQGLIYEVKDITEEYKKKAVLKRLKNQSRIERFKKEIEAYKTLDNPSIPKLIDYSLESPAFFVIPLIDGEPLATFAPYKKIEALDIFIQLCEVVEYAHSKGIIHRDLKPDNVLLDSNSKIYVIDFGLSYFIEDDTRLTEEMEQVGSRFYIAPEMESGKADNVDGKVDVYGLGKILYFLLTGTQVSRENCFNENSPAIKKDDPQLDYVTNHILKFSVCENPSERKNVAELREKARIVRRLIFEHYYPGREGSQCRFCGVGEYQNEARLLINLKEGTLTHSKPFTTLFCSNCGHIDWFISS